MTWLTDPERRRQREADLYGAAVGADALERQRRERGERHPCCGELVADGHHMMCSKRPADEPPAHVEGQEALL